MVKKKGFSKIMGSVIDNKVKDMKLIKSLENRGILLKGTTKKVNS